MAFNFSPKIVTDGLILYLDAASRKSYVSGSTTWRDLSRNQINGTLVNGPTFDSSNGGNILFDGIDDVVNLSDNIYTRFPHDSAWSFCITYMPVTQNTTFPGIIIKGASASSGILIYYNAGGFKWKHNNSETVITTTDLGIIKQITVTYAGSGNVNLYTNGVFRTAGTAMASTDTSSQLQLGSGDARGNVRIYQFLKYNKVLSATEVLQNFNATKGRFGL